MLLQSGAKVKLNDYVVEKFIEYIKGNVSKSPHLFAVSVDGWGYNFYCSTGSSCRGGDEQILQECSRYSKGVECFLFARNRTIKWKKHQSEERFQKSLANGPMQKLETS